RPLYAELVKPGNRLRKDGSERLKDGTIGKSPMRLGPLTFEARRFGLDSVLAIQEEINTGAHDQGRPPVDLINAEEKARIEELIADNTWPEGWSGLEVLGNKSIPQVFPNGLIQPLLLSD